MNPGIEIEFFETEKPEVLKKGKLFIDEFGKDYLDFSGGLIDCYRPLNSVHAKAIHSGIKYTLVNCFFKQSKSHNIRFVINELYKGDYIKKVTEPDCLEIEAKMTGLTNWINQPRIKPKVSFSLDEQSEIVIKEEFKISFYVSQYMKMELSEYCGFKFERNEAVLNNISHIKFICEKPASRLELFKNITTFLKLLSLFTNDFPTLNELKFVLTNGKEIEYLTVKGSKLKNEIECYPQYRHIQSCWPTLIERLFKYKDNFVRVIDLLNASIKNNTAEISFLNITTAFEVFHQMFHEKGNETLRNELSNELLDKHLINRVAKKWDQIVRYYHLFKIMEGTDFFKQNIRTPLKTLEIMVSLRATPYFFPLNSSAYLRDGKTENKS